jgi:hypothetical protein
MSASKEVCTVCDELFHGREGDYNVPNYNWSYGSPLPDAHYYSKMKGNLFLAAICFLGLNQHDTVPNGSLLDLVFTNMNDLSVSISDFSMVSLDKYHPPLLLDFQLMLAYSYLLSMPHLYGQGDYLLLYNTLLDSDWSCVHNENSLNSAILNLTAIVFEAINHAIVFVKCRNSAFCIGSPAL